MKKVEAGKYDIEHGIWKNVSKEAKDLIKKLLTYDPAERISAETALQHPWICDRASVQLDEGAAEQALNNFMNFRAD